MSSMWPYPRSICNQPREKGRKSFLSDHREFELATSKWTFVATNSGSHFAAHTQSLLTTHLNWFQPIAKCLQHWVYLDLAEINFINNFYCLLFKWYSSQAFTISVPWYLFINTKDCKYIQVWVVFQRQLTTCKLQLWAALQATYSN